MLPIKIYPISLDWAAIGGRLMRAEILREGNSVKSRLDEARIRNKQKVKT